MPVLSARARWLVPAVAAAAVAATGGALALAASAAPSLPPKSAAQLLTDLQRANLTPFSGTVVQTASLGLPALPQAGKANDVTDLISGSNTLRVWYGGPDRVRLALLGTLGETDLIRNGKDVWTWNSDENAYTHNQLSGAAEKPAPSVGRATPQEAAQDALALIGPTTNVSTDGTAQVAHRKAYELVLSPKDSRSLVGEVRIAVDAERSVPLRVRVFARGATKPAFEVGFTQVSFTPPGAEQFTFTPPRGSHRTPGTGGGLAGLPLGHVPVDPSELDPNSVGQRGAAVSTASKVIGSGWTRVVVVPARTGDLSSSPIGSVLTQLPRVSGPWGSGQLFSGPLFSVVLTDDGRLAVGAVAPEALYQALGTR
jgi:outer membrane lipoprotein-sorting protein